MPYKNPTFTASSGFDSFSIPIKSNNQNESNIDQAPELPQTTKVNWSSNKKVVAVDHPALQARHLAQQSIHPTEQLDQQSVQPQSSGLVMSTVAGPTAISATNFRSAFPTNSTHSSLPQLTTMGSVANSAGTTMNAPSSGWNMPGNTGIPPSSSSSNYQFPYSTSNQMAANSQSAINTPSSNSSSSAYQYQPQHQHSNSMGHASNMDLSSNSNFTAHRRVNTESTIPSAQYFTGYAGSMMGGNAMDQNSEYHSYKRGECLSFTRQHVWVRRSWQIVSNERKAEALVDCKTHLDRAFVPQPSLYLHAASQAFFWRGAFEIVR